MNRILKVAVLGLILAAGARWASAGVRAAVSVGDNGNHFYLSIGDYYQVQQDRVSMVRQRNIPDEELPVVFFIAQQGHVSADEVVAYRLRRKAWRDVAKHFGLGPDAFYVQLNKADGPYGRPYANYGRTKREKWGKVKLEDADIVNFVNLRFLSEKYKCSPDQIVQWRASGRPFADMDRDLYKPAGRPLMKKVVRQDNRDDRKDMRDNQKDDRMDRRDDQKDGRKDKRNDDQR